MSERCVRASKAVFIAIASISIVALLVVVPAPSLFSRQDWPILRLNDRNSTTLDFHPNWVTDLHSSLLDARVLLNQTLQEIGYCAKQKLSFELAIATLNTSLTKALEMLNISLYNSTSCTDKSPEKAPMKDCSDAANSSAPTAQAAPPVVRNAAYIGSPLSCSWIEEFGGSHPANFAALAQLCATGSYRPQLHARVIPEFMDRFVRLSNGTGILEEAFVSFISGPIAYLNLVQWAIAAASTFSSRPVLLFASGETVPVAAARFPSAAFPSLVVFEVPPPQLNPWFDKLRAVLLSPVLNGVIIEADTIITPHADRLFNVAKTHATDVSLSPMHEDERLPDCSNYRGARACINAYNYPAAQRTMPYIHAHMIWNCQSKAFVARVLATCVNSPSELDCGSDEGALNHELWKEKVTKHLCLMDPHQSVLESWETLTISHPALEKQNFAVVFLHGSKDPARAEHVFNRIKALQTKKHPWVWINHAWSTDSDDNAIRALSESYGCLL